MRGLLVCALLAGVGLAEGALAVPALAQQGSTLMGREAIVRGLTPPVTRNLSVVAPPSVSLDIPFEFDSARMTDQAVRQVTELAAALTSKDLGRSSIEIDGHTDAHGTPGYNQLLSERRAATVRDYLISQYGVSPERLRVAGYGFSRLKVPADPFDPANRRVEILNLTRPGS